MGTFAPLTMETPASCKHCYWSGDVGGLLLPSLDPALNNALRQYGALSIGQCPKCTAPVYLERRENET